MRAFMRGVYVVLGLLIVGCSTTDFTSVMSDVDAREWYAPAVVEFEVSDTVSVVDVMIVARHVAYGFSDSVQLNVTTISPDSTEWSEPFTLHLQAKEPRKSRSTITEVPYRRHVKWQRRGHYKIEFRPHSIYQGVESIGVNIIPYQE